jgi:hypothetical protein
MEDFFLRLACAPLHEPGRDAAAGYRRLELLTLFPVFVKAVERSCTDPIQVEPVSFIEDQLLEVVAIEYLRFLPQ